MGEISKINVNGAEYDVKDVAAQAAAAGAATAAADAATAAADAATAAADAATAAADAATAAAAAQTTADGALQKNVSNEVGQRFAMHNGGAVFWMVGDAGNEDITMRVTADDDTVSSITVGNTRYVGLGTEEVNVTLEDDKLDMSAAGSVSINSRGSNIYIGTSDDDTPPKQVSLNVSSDVTFNHRGSEVFSMDNAECNIMTPYVYLGNGDSYFTIGNYSNNDDVICYNGDSLYLYCNGGTSLLCGTAKYTSLYCNGNNVIEANDSDDGRYATFSEPSTDTAIHMTPVEAWLQVDGECKLLCTRGGMAIGYDLYYLDGRIRSGGNMVDLDGEEGGIYLQANVTTYEEDYGHLEEDTFGYIYWQNAAWGADIQPYPIMPVVTLDIKGGYCTTRLTYGRFKELVLMGARFRLRRRPANVNDNFDRYAEVLRIDIDIADRYPRVIYIDFSGNIAMAMGTTSWRDDENIFTASNSSGFNNI